MGSRTLPIECSHGTIIDYGDFGPCQDCSEHPDGECPNFVECEQCLWDAERQAQERRERVIAEAVKLCLDKCGGAGWRGRFCGYHEGFIDGYDAALSSDGTDR